MSTKEQYREYNKRLKAKMRSQQMLLVDKNNEIKEHKAINRVAGKKIDKLEQKVACLERKLKRWNFWLALFGKKIN